MPSVHLSLYCDGSSHARGSKPIGWGWILVSAAGPIKCGSGGQAEGTNNVAELTAILKGLWYCAQAHDLKILDICSDSQYALGAASGANRVYKNADLVAELRDVVGCLVARGVDVRFHWVRGHAGHVWQERADRMAVAAKERVVAGLSRQAVAVESSS